MLWSGWASSQVWIFQVLEKSIEIVTPIWWGWGGGVKVGEERGSLTMKWSAKNSVPEF